MALVIYGQYRVLRYLHIGYKYANNVAMNSLKATPFEGRFSRQLKLLYSAVRKKSEPENS
jgi:hypothetical protein